MPPAAPSAPPAGPTPASDSKSTPAWTAPELAAPHAHADKPSKVRAMFAAIAGSYDLNNRLHSLGRDQAWRRTAVRTAAVNPGDHVLDVACGTGDLTQAFARTPAARVTGLDFTREMLNVAERKRAALPSQLAARIAYIEGDAMALPFPDASFDVVSIAFGIRNVADPARALGEFARVLRPGGRLVVLEFDRPANPLMRWFNDVYCARVMPVTATLVSGDRSGAYRYLPASVGTFMTRGAMADLLAARGFRDVASRALSMGICVCYRGVRA